MTFRSFVPPLLLAAATCFLSACATTTINSTWRDEADTAGTPRKIVVFVAVKDENLRKMAENRVVQSLPPGTAPVAGHQLDLAPELEVDTVRARLVKSGFDAALVARLVSVDKSQTVIPAQTQFMTDPMFWNVGPRYRSFYTYYPYVYTTPSYTVENTRVIVETLLYRLPEGKPVWTAISESINPQSSLQVVDELIKLISKKLKTEGLLPPD
jgi:hypothetical protein